MGVGGGGPGTCNAHLYIYISYMWAALSCDSIQLQDSWRLNWFHLTSRTLLTCHHVTLWGGSLYQYLPNTMSTIFDHLWTYSLCPSSNVSKSISRISMPAWISSTLRCPVGTPHHVWHAWTQQLPNKPSSIFSCLDHTRWTTSKRTIITCALHFLAFSIIFLHKSPFTKPLHTKNGMCRQYIHWFRPKIHHLQQGDDSMTQSPSRLDEALSHGPRTMRAPDKDSETPLSPTATHV